MSNEERGIILASEEMTLRDYFAAKALQGMLASPHNWTLPEKGELDEKKHAVTMEDFSRLSYLCADEMLKARATEGE